jgi:DNA-binding transcriptional MerR regulator
MEKSPDAFRTISEVADLLETPAHVLRFWESRFPQIRPVKRAGGRRYYRPADVALLTGIKRLLHDEGMTIRGVQKILREQGVRHVSGMAEDMSVADDDAALAAALAGAAGGDDSPAAQDALPLPPAEQEMAQVIALQAALTAQAGGTGDLFAALPGYPPEQPAESPPEVPMAPPPEMPAETPREMPSEPELPETPPSAPPEEAPVPETPEIPDSSDEVAEAPMALWAEPEDDGEEGASVLPGLKVTRIGRSGDAPPAPTSLATVRVPPLPPEPLEERAAEPSAELAPQPAPDLPASPASATLAARLRQVSPVALSPADRAAFSLLRARARSLRDRLSQSPRHGF